MYRRTVPSRIDFVPPGRETTEPRAAAAHPESVTRTSSTPPSRIASLSMYGRTFPGATRGTLPAVREPHSAATAQASGISRKRKEARPRAARSRTPETATPEGPAASPRKNPARNARRSRYSGPCPRNGWSMAAGNGKTRTARLRSLLRRGLPVASDAGGSRTCPRLRARRSSPADCTRTVSAGCAALRDGARSCALETGGTSGGVAAGGGAQ